MDQLELDFHQSLHWDPYLNSLFTKIIHNECFEEEVLGKGRKVVAIVHNCTHLPREFTIYLHAAYAVGSHKDDLIFSDLSSNHPSNHVVCIFGDGYSPKAFGFDLLP
jgi:hypothetical protein